MNELIALIADAESWRLSRVYAVEGKFARSDYRDEPAAGVEGAANPVLIGRSPSGLPAIGECTQALGEFYFGPGGEREHYRVGLLPVSFEEAASFSGSAGAARVVAYAYQSYAQGRLPAETDIVDIFAQNRPETIRLQKEAGRLIEYMTGHGEFEPYLNPQASVERAHAEAGRLASRFVAIPDTDPLVGAANDRSVCTVSDIKADAGGKVGHTTPPYHFQFVAEASLEEAKQLGLILPASRILEVGDDEHLLMTHKRGADDNTIHLFAYRTFFRQIWVAETLGYKWYEPRRGGLGLDRFGYRWSDHRICGSVRRSWL